MISAGHRCDVVVLGAGIVGVCVALHLQMAGSATVLIDRSSPGEGTSFGNAGMIQTEAVMPHAFPRALPELLRVARNRSVDAVYHLSALGQLTGSFLRYWHNSTPERIMAIARARAPLVVDSANSHWALAVEAGATDLLRPTGWTAIYRTEAPYADAVDMAKKLRAQFGVASEQLSGKDLVEHERRLKGGLAGAIHWTTPLSLSDPYALTQAYSELFLRLGGKLLRGDARSIRRDGEAWRLESDEGPVFAEHAVNSLGAWARDITDIFDYRPPYFVKRGYHQHLASTDGSDLTCPILDAEYGYMLVPMRSGTRLTTGAEFARRDAGATPIQLERALPLARQLVSGLGASIDQPWLGHRPCLPDMLPVIGPAPGQERLWYAFGHAHQGLTMAADTGRLIAAMIQGQTPFTDPHPYRADRFSWRKLA